MPDTTTYRALANVNLPTNGPRFPVENRRVAPTDASKFIQRVDHLTVEQYFDEPNVGYARLYEAATATVGGQGLIVRAENGERTWSGTLSYPPEPSQYYFNPYMGFVFFNRTDIGQKIIVNYTGKGSIIAAEEINWLWNICRQVGLPFTDRIVEIPGGMSVDIMQEYVLNVFAITRGPDNEIAALEKDPAYVKVVYANPDAMQNYFTRITNTDTSVVSREFKIRTLKRAVSEL